MKKIVTNSFGKVYHILQRKMAPKVIYVHIPKCGGTSIYHGISKSLYGTHPDGYIDPIRTREFIGENQMVDTPELSNNLQLIRKAILNEYASSHKNMISGHFPIDNTIIKNYSNNYKFITVLRKPEDRLFSHFKYTMATRKLNFDYSYKSLKRVWEEYIDSDLAKFHANLFSVYFGEADYNLINENNVLRAIENLKQFDLVGLLSDLPKFCSDFKSRYDTELTIQNKNNSNEKLQNGNAVGYFGKLYEEVKFNELPKLCAWDMKIYTAWINHKRLLS